MKVWQTLLVVGVVGAGGVLLYMALTKNQARGAPPPQTSVVAAAYQGTGSTGEDSGTNKYDAIIGIGGIVGGVLESGISSGWFKSDEPATDVGVPALLARP